MKISKYPVWLVGFRPFFMLAVLSGLSFPILWALIYSGVFVAPNSSLTTLQWHAHEMFFGFGMAVLGGFLLTSTKNWVQIRGYHGGPLIFLTGAWIFERVGMSFGGAWPRALFLISNNLFLASLIVMLLRTLISHHKTDSYKDNVFFVMALPFFLVSKYLLLHPEHYLLGVTMTLGLFRMAFLLMLERTITQFMKNIFQASVLRNVVLDFSIKILGFVLIFDAFIPTFISTWLILALAILLGVRFIFWKPAVAFKRLGVGIMHLGYLAIMGQLLVEFLTRFLSISWVGSLSVHVFTFGVMGLIIPAMIIRISNGHTGRKAVFDLKDRLVLWVMILAFILRVIASQFFPDQYGLIIFAAALCWFISFSILAWRYTPYLLGPRADGKEH